MIPDNLSCVRGFAVIIERSFRGDIAEKPFEPYLFFGGTPAKATLVLDPQVQFARVFSQFRLTLFRAAVLLNFDQRRFRKLCHLAVLNIHVPCRFQPSGHSVVRSSDCLSARFAAINIRFAR